MKKVLLIEDDAILRENTAELLELANYNVFTASNGQLGLETAKKETPDIIVCDIMMPVLDGYAVLDHLSKNEKTKYIPFIFLSAKTEHKDIRKGMDLGADDYIPKPFSEEELVSAIESRLAKASILKEQKNTMSTSSNNLDEHDIKSLNDLKNFFDDYGNSFTFGKDTIIYSEGDHSNHIYLIKKGNVKCHQIDEQGKELITTLYQEDDLFGYTSFTSNQPHKETATAITLTEVSGISYTKFNEILDENPKLAIELIQLLSDDLLVAKNQLLEMAYGSVSKKTASTILKFAEKINRKPDAPINISRNDLASVAGIATETLIRTLTSFRKEGIIKTEGRNITVVDLEKLKAMS